MAITNSNASLNRSFTLVLSLACLVGVAGCAKGLSGTFKTGCIVDEPGASSVTTATFDDDKFSGVITSYANETCAAPSISTTIAGSFKESASSIDGATNIDSTFTEPADLAGTIVYDIYKLDGNSLFFGDSATGDGTTPALRPSRLESSASYSKVAD